MRSSPLNYIRATLEDAGSPMLFVSDSDPQIRSKLPGRLSTQRPLSAWRSSTWPLRYTLAVGS